MAADAVGVGQAVPEAVIRGPAKFQVFVKCDAVPTLVELSRRLELAVDGTLCGPLYWRVGNSVKVAYLRLIRQPPRRPRSVLVLGQEARPASLLRLPHFHSYSLLNVCAMLTVWQTASILRLGTE